MTNKEAFDTITQNLEKALAPIKFKSKSAKKARLKLTAIQADKAEGLASPGADFERALYRAWSEGNLDSIDCAIEERKLAARRMRDLLPAVKGDEAEAEKKFKAAEAELNKAREVRFTLAQRLGNEEEAVRKLETDRTFYSNAAQQIAAGERLQFWQPRSGFLPPREEPVTFTMHDFAYDPADPRVSKEKLEKAAAEWTRRYNEAQEHSWQERCRAERLGITIKELHLLEEAHEQIHSNRINQINQ